MSYDIYVEYKDEDKDHDKYIESCFDEDVKPDLIKYHIIYGKSVYAITTFKKLKYIHLIKCVSLKDEFIDQKIFF